MVKLATIFSVFTRNKPLTFIFVILYRFSLIFYFYNFIFHIYIIASRRHSAIRIMCITPKAPVKGACHK